MLMAQKKMVTVKKNVPVSVFALGIVGSPVRGMRSRTCGSSTGGVCDAGLATKIERRQLCAISGRNQSLGFDPPLRSIGT
jgi:hypothetical protein